MGKRIAAFIQRFPVFIIALTVALAGFAGWFGSDVSSHLKGGGFAALGSESAEVAELVERFDTAQADMIVVMAASEGKITDQPNKEEIARQAEAVARQSGVDDVKTHVSTGSDELISQDHKKSLMLVSLTGNETEQSASAKSLRKSMQSDRLSFQFGGMASLNSEISEQVSKDLVVAETVSFAVLAVLLVVVFRGFVAALLPLLLGGLAILGAFAALKLIAQVTPVVEYAMNVIILLGLGLAVDYALLIVSRFREELYAFKNDARKALAKTYETAGRTVLFSGLTVIISLASLTVFPLDFLRSMGIGGVAAVTIALLAALVVLPAILRMLGHRVNWLSFGSAKKMHKAARHGVPLEVRRSVWYKTGAFFMKRPVATMVMSLGMLALAMVPVFSIQLASPDENVLPKTAEGRQVSAVLKDDFGMDTETATVLYSADSLTSKEEAGKLYDYVEKLKNTEGVEDVESIVTLVPGTTRAGAQQLLTNLDNAPAPLKSAIDERLDGGTTLLSVEYRHEPSSDEARQLITALRSHDTPGATALVGGFTAELVDQLAMLERYLPYALAIIGITLFVLLFLMLGSIVIPIKAMLQNLLSLGATFGGMALLFGEGFFSDVLPINATGVIYATLPAMIFAIAFGLSMDYSVFLYSRIKEQFDISGNNDEAVLVGLQKTGGIITSAALLLFVVVIAFATSGIAIMQQIGVGLALAILLDAFVVRMVLVPATMRLLGRYNWWAPKSLKRLQQRLGWEEKP